MKTENYPNIAIIKEALKDLSKRFDIPEIGVGYNVILIRHEDGSLKSLEIPFEVRGQFSAIVTSAIVEVRAYYVSETLSKLYLKFSYEHAFGSNGYTSKFMIVGKKHFNGVNYVGVLDGLVYDVLEQNLVERVKK